MTSLTIRVDDKAFRRGMRLAPKEVSRAVDLALGRAAQEVARDARINTPKAFSHLTQSIHVSKPSPLVRMVSAGVRYAHDVEFGQPPGRMPRRANILAWMKVKKIAQSTRLPRQKSIAFLIARSIKRHGTKKQPFMQPALDKNRARIVKLVDDGVAAGLRNAGLV